MTLTFFVRDTPIRRDIPRATAYLYNDKWDDWGKFATQYFLVVCDGDGNVHEVGSLKVGRFGLTPRERRCSLPPSFTALPARHFSLGQSVAYYMALWSLGADLRSALLTGLCDIVNDTGLFDEAEDEPVMQDSLLRDVRPMTVRGQFARLLRGGAISTPYHFAFVTGASSDSNPPGLTLDFLVVPDKTPPTNIHAIIGPNGCGKTRLLQSMWVAAQADETPDPGAPRFVPLPTRADDDAFHSLPSERDAPFANVAMIAFSAFDPATSAAARLMAMPPTTARVVISLRKSGEVSDQRMLLKSSDELDREFGEVLARIRNDTVRLARWHEALDVLIDEQGFRDIHEMLGASTQVPESLFTDLSSGHRIVLLSLASVVAVCTERTLILVDEPESHLHPPLLAGFLRALSLTLESFNSVGIVATHSPVVLQSIPSSCAWILTRSHTRVKAERPQSETFGENISVLTRDVFGLRASSAGFFGVLKNAVARSATYEDALGKLGNTLGSDGRYLLRAMIAAKNAGGGA